MRRWIVLVVVALILGVPGRALGAPAAPARPAAPGATGTASPAGGASDDLTTPPDANLPADAAARLDELNRRIDASNGKEADLLADIEASDKRRADLDASIAELARQIADLQSQLVAVKHDVERTTATFVGAERAAEDAAEHLHDVQERLSKRAAQVYKDGPGATANLILGARDVEEAFDRITYVRHLVASDKELVGQFDAAQQDYEDRSVELERLKGDQLSSLARIEGVQSKIKRAEAQQKTAREQVETELDHKRAVLAKVQSDRAAWQALVARQQQDSLRVTGLLANSGPAPAGVIANFFMLPVLGEVTSPFGWRTHPVYGTALFHAGLDLAVPEGTPIKAAAAGVVISAGWMGGYGNAILINHGNGVASLYGHQSQLASDVGRVVQQGDVIGYAGSTGVSTGPHVHFEVRVGGEPTDPVPWLKLS